MACTLMLTSTRIANISHISGTITNAAALLKEKGARAVYACCTHAVFRYFNNLLILHVLYLLCCLIMNLVSMLEHQ